MTQCQRWKGVINNMTPVYYDQPLPDEGLTELEKEEQDEKLFEVEREQYLIDELGREADRTNADLKYDHEMSGIKQF